MLDEQIRIRNDMPLDRQILRLTSTTRKQDLNICDCPFELTFAQKEDNNIIRQEGDGNDAS